MNEVEPAVLADIHNHLVPGVDDGSRNLDESIRNLRELRSQGVTQLATSSHLNGWLVYENALAHLLRKSGLAVEQQYPIQVSFDGIGFGEFFADLLVEGRVLVELKADSDLTPEHTAQALNYLRATGLDACLLINFGKPKVEIKRLLPSVNWKQKAA